uniref:NADH dehydrogenase subunit 6 n=1 Tax=Parascaphoidella transversa TaxID=2914186 RepID=UPI001EDD7BE5|nr:NADH dehydrogenase subunit 6 [Parascaphoidella transversa]UKE80336.1 NADH dehydrogenase subunit 6 [Parascaphoidella transversa]
MKMIMLKFMLMISSVIPILSTPMSMGIFLLIQTSISTMLMAKLMVSSWMPMIMFLMLIGGLLILFMYMSSIASNEKFKPTLMFFLFFTLMLIPFEEMMSENQMNDIQQWNFPIESITLLKIYNKKTMAITIMVFLYLLLAMISVTKIIKIYSGPLRSK